MLRRVAQETSPRLLETGYDVPGTPLPAYLEPYIFPKYLTDDVREQSLLSMVPDIVEAVVAGSGESWQEIFDSVLADLDEDLSPGGAFSEVRRKVWQQLPPDLQMEVQW